MSELYTIHVALTVLDVLKLLLLVNIEWIDAKTKKLFWVCIEMVFVLNDLFLKLLSLLMIVVQGLWAIEINWLLNLMIQNWAPKS